MSTIHTQEEDGVEKAELRMIKLYLGHLFPPTAILSASFYIGDADKKAEVV